VRSCLVDIDLGNGIFDGSRHPNRGPQPSALVQEIHNLSISKPRTQVLGTLVDLSHPTHFETRFLCDGIIRYYPGVIAVAIWDFSRGERYLRFPHYLTYVLKVYFLFTPVL
jgi:hypothetical protein